MYAKIENLGEVLDRLNLSKAQVADSAGVSVATLNRALAGERLQKSTAAKLKSLLDQYESDAKLTVTTVAGGQQGLNATESNDVREVFVQSSWNTRAFMLLRFRHFATFSVILAFIGTGAFRVEAVADFKGYILIFGVLMTIAFWILDFRTGEYLSYHARRMGILEKKMLDRFEDLNLPSPPRPKLLSASMVTNIIFLLILLGWLSFTVIQFWTPSYSVIFSPGTEQALTAENHPP
jgi:transcriptional regulator with XRE-family HTH domain